MEITFENYTLLKQQYLSRAEIAQIFGIPDWKLKKLIAANKWGKALPTIGCENVFDEYSEASCYWAGFLAADGNVDAKHRVRLMLKYDDILHLHKFKQLIQSDHVVSSNTTIYNRCSFEFTSRHICDMLELNYNIVPNKTDKYLLPKMPDRYFRHFVRGYFDGDGSICESFSNANSLTATLYATFCSGSYHFIHSLFDRVHQILGLVGHLQDFGTGKKWQIKYNTNDAIKLLSWMYKDSSVSLDRKYALYNQIVVCNIRQKRDKGIVHPV